MTGLGHMLNISTLRPSYDSAAQDSLIANIQQEFATILQGGFFQYHQPIVQMKDLITALERFSS